MNRPVLVVGGGLTGLQASSSLLDAGLQVVLLEQGPILGGKRGAWLGDEQHVEAQLSAVAAHPAVEVLTMASLQRLEGEAGAFAATVQQQPRYVTDQCTRCNHCAPVCPQAVANEYDAGLTFRKAIHSPYPQTIPDIFTIDINTCLNTPPNYLPCQRCVEVCDDQAIHFDITPPPELRREVSAVVVATGFADNDVTIRESLSEFGYGSFPDVLSSVELQRMLEDPGPSGGFAVCPSDESYPDSVILVMPVISAASAWVMTNQVQRLLAQGVEDLAVLVLASESDHADLAELREVLASQGVPLLWGSWLGLERGEDKGLQLGFVELPSGTAVRRSADLFVLSVEIHPGAGTAALAERLGLDLDPGGYLVASRPGIHVAGGALGTLGSEAGAEQARAAVAEIVAGLATPPVAEAAASAASPDWGQLPGDRQQAYLESLLLALLKAGEGGKS